MHPISFISMLVFSSISLVLIRVLAPFQETFQETFNLKYVSLKSDFLAKCLIPRKDHIKQNDRKKISLFSLIFSFLFIILVLVLLLMVILPPIPCEPFNATFGRHGVVEWVVNTVNEKIIWGLPMLLFCIELIAVILIGIPRAIKSKTESKKSLLGQFVTVLFLAGLSLFLIFLLFL